MKTIGTDVSLNVCKNEGYLMIQFDGIKKFNPNTKYRIFGYMPAYIDNNKNRKPILSVYVSWKELEETYQQNKQGIDSFADDMPSVMAEPSIYNLLNAASTINSYCGLS